ncbi:MAG: diacylglycerol kinase family lipid kinase [Melioribacteraceae bacterium]|jgi:YegS/Rv2252/BmrU family lipid kinase|nr:diacylglycerol kinase family lipid kinase [Melioribacteraceae bacterium]
MKVFHLNNPASGNGNGRRLFSHIKRELDANRIEHETVQTEYAGHGTEIVRNLKFENYDALTVSGGDGTLFETINGYFANPSVKRIPIGIIPIGRGNAFARDLEFHPKMWGDAIDTISFNKTKHVDVALCSTKEGQFYFINILGLGFVTDVAKTAFKLRAFGHLSYILGVLHRTISLKPFNLKLEIDGNKIERENVFVEISNSRYTGKDFLMAPSASIDDGLLDITLLNKLSRARLLQCLPKIFTGDHIKMKEVECFNARKIKIETEPEKLLTPDGQLTGSTPIEIECLTRSLKVITR